MTDKSLDKPVKGQNLCKTFRRETGEVVTALDGVSFVVDPGSLTAIVGPDGAGKTTLLRVICGLVAPDDGTMDVLGIDVAKSPQDVQDRIGYMPQKFGLYEDLSVQENLDLYADLHGVSAAERRAVYLVLYLGLALFLAAAIGMGLFLSSIAKNMQQAMILTFVVLMPFMLLSGLMAPTENMPEALRYFTMVNPLQYAITITRRVYLEGATLSQLLPDMFALIAIAAVTMPVSAWFFRNKLV